MIVGATLRMSYLGCQTVVLMLDAALGVMDVTNRVTAIAKEAPSLITGTSPARLEPASAVTPDHSTATAPDAHRSAASHRPLQERVLVATG